MRRTFCLLAVAASLSVTSVGAAQQNPQQTHEEAVKLFLEGKSLRDGKEFGEAIKKLELSVAKEESIGARYNLGICYENAGNKKLALFNYKKAEQLAKDKGDDRLREIGAQLRVFFDQTTHIRLALPQPTPPELQVLIDGKALPNEEFEGLQVYFPPAKREKYELRVSAPGYEDLQLPIDSTTADKKIAVTVVLKKVGENGALRPEPRIIGTKWGPFQFLGLGLIAVGAAGITYAGVDFLSYTSKENELRNKFGDAESAAENCPSMSPPESTCGKNIKTREDLRTDYNKNEDRANTDKTLWFAFAIGGALAIGGGVMLIVAGPRTDVYSTAPGASAKTAPRPTFRVVPTVTVREQGVSLVGTF